MREKFKSFTEKAQGMVEFALILPLLLVLLFGIIEAGRMLFIYSSVVSSSREAARYGSASGEYDNVIRYEDCDGIRSAAKRSGTLVDIQDGNIDISYDMGSETSQISASCPPSENVELGNRINIMVSAHYEPIVPLVNFSGFDISSSTARTIIKDVPIHGTPMSPESAPDPVVYFSSLEIPIVPEGDTYTVTVRMSYPIGEDVIVVLSFDGDAVKGECDDDDDYSASNSVVIPNGKTEGTIAITACEDEINGEPDETVEITLVSVDDGLDGEPLAKIGGPDTSQVIIADTYNPPEVFFILAQDEVLESKGLANIVAELSFATSKDVTVPITVTGSATMTVDYEMTPSNALSFPAGVKYASIVVTLIDDDEYEEDEDIIVTMGSPTNATLSGSEPTEHTLTITHPEVYFTLEDQSVDESTEEVTVEVAIDQPSYKDVLVNFSIIDGAAEHPAEEVKDYEIDTTSPLTITAGSTSADITLTIKDDELDEYDETITLQLDSSDDAAIGTTYDIHTVTIIDDDEPPEVFFSSASQSAGEASGRIDVNVELSVKSGKPITVTYKIDGSSTAKKQGAKADFTIDVVDLVFSPDETSKDISFDILDDELDEDNETVVLRLDSAENATIGIDNINTTTIEDDDPKVYFSSSGKTAGEGDDTITVEVVLSTSPNNNVTVPFSVSGTATKGADGDFTIDASPLTISAGSTSGTITITINDDALEEGNETIVLTLINPTNAELGDPTVHTVTINDNDESDVIPLDHGEKTEKWRLLK